MKCALHPEVETNLTCGKCGKPICPRCMVQTPVGARCPDCARLSRLPTFRVSGVHYLRAIGAGVGVAIACGIIWAFVRVWVPFFYFNLLLAPIAGYAIGEVISLSVNRKRGTGLAVIAGVAVLLSYFITACLPLGLSFHLLDALALALGIFVSITHLR